ncbi:hypothetical protein [Maricaulis maris]|jgi:hypothetical protein|uniref:Uncharacterized protein n=1 Tax=Maricaulis maris (strain MCS10) TaxID=394221 RepID=Q0ASL0_MARMM|nr:hypothetical protein [Maricaulis maris]ABI64727.1 hypothetical protein Mmar10_0434 [Maricaulis maris MCS10]
MACDSTRPLRGSGPAAAAHAQLAVRDWLETQARVTGYWRDVLLEAGGSLALIEVLDDHARFLQMAAIGGEGEVLQTQ